MNDVTDVFTRIAGEEIVWRDPLGVVHLCEGADVHPGIRLIWTRCAGGVPTSHATAPGALDVPAGCAWLRRKADFITCVACAERKVGAEPKEFVG